MLHAKNKYKSFISGENLILLIIIVAGAVLRFWKYQQIPFMHDELSALSRLQFSGLSDVVRYGVMLGDTHPAGVQIFLFYWTKLGGESEMWVKLPFILAGIISVVIAYKIGKVLFDGTTGLLTAAMVSSTQIFIMYSQLARPYSSGLLLTLVMVYFWSCYFYKERKNIYLVYFVAFASLSSYNHHFSLLFAAIVGFSGLFLIKSKRELVAYLVSGIVIFILYIPHLEIFFNQLSTGGIGGEGGWLAKPRPTFLMDYIAYLLHFSWLNWLIFICVVIFLIVAGKKLTGYTSAIQKRVILLSWFLAPILIGYFYSVLVNPIIQYSLLVFSTPYIYMLIFSFHRRIKPQFILGVVIMLLLINTYALALERHHFKLFYQQPYEELFKTALIDNRDENVFIINDCVPYYNEYYFRKYEKTVPYFTKRNSDIDRSGFRKMVSNITEDKVIAHSLDAEEFRMVKEYFPGLESIKQGFTYDIYTFSRSNENELKGYDTIAAYTYFNEPNDQWKNTDGRIRLDTLSNTYYCFLDSTDIWGPSVSMDLEKLAPDGYGIIDAVVECVFEDKLAKTLLVGSIRINKETVFWTAEDATDYLPEVGEKFRFYLGIDLQTALAGRKDSSDMEIQFNIWNKNKISLKITSINISLRPGNPVRYGLYSKI